MDLVEAVYQLTALYPGSEQYGLTAHTRRTVVSIPSNIAEGSRRLSRRDYRRFVVIAFATGAELETQLEIALRLKYAREDQMMNSRTILDEVMKMLNRMINSLRT